MKDKKSNDLILAYLTPDLFGLSKESLIFEIIWLRYCLDFQDAAYFMKRSKGGKNRVKKPHEEFSSYDNVRVEIFRQILIRASQRLPVTKKHIEQVFDGRDEYSETLIKEIYGLWRKHGFEIVGLLAKNST